MSAKMYQKIFRKYYKESMSKMYLHSCSERCLMGLMTWGEYEREYKREFNLFKQKFIKYFPQVKLKELK